MPESLPPAAVMVVHEVDDFDRWKSAFDDHKPLRIDGGIIGHHINRAEEDPNLISTYLAVSDLARAQAFGQSEELRSAMHEAGVIGRPELTWMTPVCQSVVWDRQLPAALVTHGVADFDAWLAGYESADALRSENGIIGHAANRSIDDSATVVVYHQAESFDALRAFLGLPELKAAMATAGVTSEPIASFHTGGWAEMY